MKHLDATAMLTAEEAANSLKTTPRTVRNHCRAKNIKGAKLVANESAGRMEWRIPRSSLETFAAEYDLTPGRKPANNGE